MTFFRIKKIKGNEYVYRVENEWGGKSSRQKVKGYLGRAFRPDLKSNLVFNEFCKISDIEKYFNNNTTEKIIKDLIEWEIAMHAIEKENFDIRLEDKKIQKRGKDIVIVINGGFMCGFTLANLLEFKTESEEQDGNRLARAFVEAGIRIPEEVFIGLFAKLYKQPEKEAI